MVELLPGTSIPVFAPGSQHQPEGRGTPELAQPRGVSLFEKLMDRDDVSAAEAAVVAAALRAYDTRPKREKHVFDQKSGQTDTTTGNLVLQLFECPQGWEGHVAFVTADTPGTAAITATAPIATAGTWAYLAIAPPGLGGLGSPLGNANAVNSGGLRQGLFAFSPDPASSTALASLPFDKTYNDSNAPIMWGGEALFFVLVGNSLAGVRNVTIQCNYRVNLFEYAEGSA